MSRGNNLNKAVHTGTPPNYLNNTWKKNYARQNRLPMSAFKSGFTADIVLDEIKQMKKEHEVDQKGLIAWYKQGTT